MIDILLKFPRKFIWWGWILGGLFYLWASFLTYPNAFIEQPEGFTPIGAQVFWYMITFLGLIILIIGVNELTKLKMPIRIKERDKNQCIYCGKSFGATAHHILPKDIFPELKVSLNNGITVCKSHHNIAHDIFKRLQRICLIKPKSE